MSCSDPRRNPPVEPPTVPSLVAIGSPSIALWHVGLLAAAGTLVCLALGRDMASWEGHVVHSAAAGGSEAHSARPSTVVRPVSCQKLPDIPGKSVTTVLVDFPPGAFTPQHRHPGTVTAYVLTGTLRSQLQGGRAETFAAGGTWFEPPGAVHMFAENSSATEPAELLAIFVADSDCGPLTIFD